MKKLLHIVVSLSAIFWGIACRGDGKIKDRTAAHDMYEHITSLTRTYIQKIEAAEDSAVWARVNLEYEDSLDKVNFHYPPDTDLLLSEGQNDTIVRLTRAYVEARDKRINSILHPISPTDTIDSISLTESLRPDSPAVALVKE